MMSAMQVIVFYNKGEVKMFPVEELAIAMIAALFEFIWEKTRKVLLYVLPWIPTALVIYFIGAFSFYLLGRWGQVSTTEPQPVGWAELMIALGLPVIIWLAGFIVGGRPTKENCHHLSNEEIKNE